MPRGHADPGSLCSCSIFMPPIFVFPPFAESFTPRADSESRLLFLSGSGRLSSSDSICSILLNSNESFSIAAKSLPLFSFLKFFRNSCFFLNYTSLLICLITLSLTSSCLNILMKSFILMSSETGPA